MTNSDIKIRQIEKQRLSVSEFQSTKTKEVENMFNLKQKESEKGGESVTDFRQMMEENPFPHTDSKATRRISSKKNTFRVREKVMTKEEMKERSPSKITKRKLTSDFDYYTDQIERGK